MQTRLIPSKFFRKPSNYNHFRNYLYFSKAHPSLDNSGSRASLLLFLENFEKSVEDKNDFESLGRVARRSLFLCDKFSLPIPGKIQEKWMKWHLIFPVTKQEHYEELNTCARYFCENNYWVISDIKRVPPMIPHS